MSSQLELLAALEEIRDLLAPVVQERQRERLYPIPALIEAHRTAHCACESVYAEQEDEARAIDTTSNSSFDVTVQWGASSASNTITSTRR